MYKEIFLCVFFAAITANSMAQPTAYDDDISERYVRGMASKAGEIVGKIAKTAIKIALGRRNAQDLDDLIAKRMVQRFAMFPENDKKIKQFLPD